jgi:Family of unknown function (DUF6370)
MKKTLFLAVALLSAGLTVRAEDTKIDGKALCAKCELKVAEKCRAAVTVTGADGKVETYFSEPNSKAKDLHKEICKEPKPAIVEGTVTEKDGQKLITITKFELK